MLPAVLLPCYLPRTVPYYCQATAMLPAVLLPCYLPRTVPYYCQATARTKIFPSLHVSQSLLIIGMRFGVSRPSMTKTHCQLNFELLS